jgi:hypothetical protein
MARQREPIFSPEELVLVPGFLFLSDAIDAVVNCGELLRNRRMLS